MDIFQNQLHGSFFIFRGKGFSDPFCRCIDGSDDLLTVKGLFCSVFLDHIDVFNLHRFFLLILDLSYRFLFTSIN